MKTNFTLKSSLMVLFLCLGLSSWGQTETFFSFTGTSGYQATPAAGWNSSGTEGGAYLKLSPGSVTSPEYSPANDIVFKYDIGSFGSGTGSNTKLFILDPLDNVISEFTLTSTTGGGTYTTNQTVNVGSVTSNFKVKIEGFGTGASVRGTRLRNYSLVGEIMATCEASNIAFTNTTVNKDLLDPSFTQTATSLNATTAIAYESSDEAIATVNATTGEVTLVGIGTATITATQEAGEHSGVAYCAGTATYDVVVTTSAPLLTVSTNSASFTGFAGGAVATETITVEGFNLTGNIALALSGDTNFSIDPNTLSADGGDITITYTPSATPATHSATLTVSNSLLSEVITLSGVTNEMPEAPAVCGLEDFTNAVNLPTGDNYGGGTFTGNDNIVWSYHGQSAGDYEIDGNGFLLRRASDSYLEATISGGIGTFSFDYRKAYTGSSSRQLELLINDSQVATSPEFGSGTGEDTTVYTFTHTVNVEGEVTVRIKLTGSATTNRHVTIDNITWTCYSGTQPTTPTLTSSVSELTDFVYGLGNGPSASQSFVLSGENLDGSDVTVTAPANFEVSTTEASGYASALTLTAYDGTETTIWVRLAAGQPVDTYAGNITISGGGAADATVAVSGAVLAVPVVTAETFNATVGESFSAQITATDNPTSYAYTGTPPAGLDFNPTTGAITGTPEAAGSFDIQVTATNIVGTSTPATVSIVVAQGVQTLVGFTDINTVLGAADIALPETTNAGLTVSYASSNTAVATVSGNTVSIVGLRTTTITATQAG